jgi:hypothetical protein
MKSANEQLVIDSIKFFDFYNDQVIPLNQFKKQEEHFFKPMSESKNTGLCPFHTDTDPSFHYWKSKGVFHCFGCGVGGDTVRIYTMIRQNYFGEKLTIKQAVEQLAQKYRIELNEEIGHEVQSPFERARNLMFNKSAYTIPKGTFNLAEFREANNKVRKSTFPMHIKVQNYEQLDLVASVAMSNHT